MEKGEVLGGPRGSNRGVYSSSLGRVRLRQIVSSFITLSCILYFFFWPVQEGGKRQEEEGKEKGKEKEEENETENEKKKK